MKTPAIRLAFGSLFWRLFLVLAVVFEVSLWKSLKPFLINRGNGVRIAVMVLKSPRILFFAFMIAALVAILIDLYVRFIMRPVMMRWLAPGGVSDEFGTPLAFRLESNETIRSEMPARLIDGRRTRPGRLVRTNRRLWFCPGAWNAETWSIATNDLHEIRVEPHHVRFGSLIRGVPDRVVVRHGKGQEATFAVLDPDELLDWYPDRATHPVPSYQPSTLELL